MVRSALVILVCVAAAAAATWTDTTSRRFSAEGLTGVGFRSSDVSVVATVRADTGRFISVRCFKSKAAGTAPGFRTGELEITGLGTGSESLLATEGASCASGDSSPGCSLDIVLPHGVGFYTDLSCGSQNRVLADGLRAMAFIKLYTGDVRLLDHRGPADVYGVNVVCTVADQRPADTLLLEAWSDLKLYYPDSIPAEVHVPASQVPAVSGLKTSFGMSTCITEYTLNPDAPGPHRYINLVRGGTVRPLADYGKDGKR